MFTPVPSGPVSPVAAERFNWKLAWVMLFLVLIVVIAGLVYLSMLSPCGKKPKGYACPNNQDMVCDTQADSATENKWICVCGNNRVPCSGLNETCLNDACVESTTSNCEGTLRPSCPSGSQTTCNTTSNSWSCSCYGTTCAAGEVCDTAAKSCKTTVCNPAAYPTSCPAGSTITCNADTKLWACICDTETGNICSSGEVCDQGTCTTNSLYCGNALISDTKCKPGYAPYCNPADNTVFCGCGGVDPFGACPSGFTGVCDGPSATPMCKCGTTTMPPNAIGTCTCNASTNTLQCGGCKNSGDPMDTCFPPSGNFIIFALANYKIFSGIDYTPSTSTSVTTNTGVLMMYTYNTLKWTIPAAAGQCASQLLIPGMKTKGANKQKTGDSFGQFLGVNTPAVHESSAQPIVPNGNALYALAYDSSMKEIYLGGALARDTWYYAQAKECHGYGDPQVTDMTFLPTSKLYKYNIAQQNIDPSEKTNFLSPDGVGSILGMDNGKTGIKAMAYSAGTNMLYLCGDITGNFWQYNIGANKIEKNQPPVVPNNICLVGDTAFISSSNDGNASKYSYIMYTDNYYSGWIGANFQYSGGDQIVGVYSMAYGENNKILFCASNVAIHYALINDKSYNTLQWNTAFTFANLRTYDGVLLRSFSSDATPSFCAFDDSNGILYFLVPRFSSNNSGEVSYDAFSFNYAEYIKNSQGATTYRSIGTFTSSVLSDFGLVTSMRCGMYNMTGVSRVFVCGMFSKVLVPGGTKIDCYGLMYYENNTNTWVMMYTQGDYNLYATGNVYKQNNITSSNDPAQLVGIPAQFSEYDYTNLNPPPSNSTLCTTCWWATRYVHQGFMDSLVIQVNDNDKSTINTITDMQPSCADGYLWQQWPNSASGISHKSGYYGCGGNEFS